MPINLITLLAFFALLIIVGLLFSKFNIGASDYIRSGGQAPWWLAGASIGMTSVSAFTFTGNGSAAFNAGPSVLIIYVANVFAMVLSGYYFAIWFRKTGAFTGADVVRERFGVPVEQFSAYAGVVLAPFGAAIQLWALSVFASSTFGFSVETCILVIGTVVICYSVTGGKWAILASDFIQGLILFSITLLVAILCYIKIGGLDAFFSYFDKPEFINDFTLVKEPNQFKNSEFSAHWMFIIFFMTAYRQLTLASADRFVSAKSGQDARYAAFFGAALIGVGSLIWLFPPMVARFLYAEEILAQDIKDPATTAYSFIAAKLLPNGLMGVMTAAMFAATMSSMDSGLNRQAGVIARNIVPRLRTLLGYSKPLSNKHEVLMCRILTLFVGLIVLGYSLWYATAENLELFQAFQIVSSVIGIPLLFPLFIGLWVKRIPSWSYFVIFVCCAIPSAISYYDRSVNLNPWTIQDRATWIFCAGVIGTLFSMPFYQYSPHEYREKVDAFFNLRTSPTPISADQDPQRNRQQRRILGYTAIALGLAMLLFTLLPNENVGRVSVLFICSISLVVGGVLLKISKTDKTPN